MVKRCTKCILSENFPRIEFDDIGVCNFCNESLLYSTEKEIIESSREEIENLFNKYRAKGEYDAIVCFSGGKDSTYTLKLAVEKYKLNVLSFTLDNGFISPTTFINIEKVVSKLGVDQITYRPSYKFMTGLFRVSSTENIYNLRTLIRISASCNSCISVVNNMALKFALEKEIPIIIAGFTLGQIPANAIYYKYNYEFMRDSREAISGKLKKILGRDVEKHMEIPAALLEKSVSSPYHINLLPLEKITETEIIDNIKKLGWEMPGDVDGCSTNCRINAFNNYVHEKRFGYSPYELELSHLIRNGSISRDEALKKIYDQPETQINDAFTELGIRPEEIDNDLTV